MLPKVFKKSTVLDLDVHKELVSLRYSLMACVHKYQICF